MSEGSMSDWVMMMVWSEWQKVKSVCC